AGLRRAGRRARPARRARPVRPAAAIYPDRARRRARGRRLPVAGPGRRGHADRADPRLRAGRNLGRRARPRPAEGRGPVPVIVLLSGGVGGAKLALGLYRSLPPDRLFVVANTGDDFEHLGLLVCPDIDTLVYTLAGLANPEQGW